MKTLLLIDLQNDFLPTGALPVPAGDQVIAIVNQLMPHFELVVATQDWHPAKHGSFAANHPGKKVGEMITLSGLPQMLWPVHCVAETPGAQFAPGLHHQKISHVVRKGSDPAIDSYSGFFDNGHRQATGLDKYLKGKGVKELYLMGLATDYCVKFTALDARALGYEVHLVLDGCRGVNIQPTDVESAIREMQAARIKVINSLQIAGV